jgi:hypothetical protein
MKIEDTVHFKRSRALRGRVDQVDGERLKPKPSTLNAQPKPSTLNAQLRDLLDCEGLEELKPHLVQVW